MMSVPPLPPDDADSRLLRLQCPHCGAEYALWFRAERSSDDTLTPNEWERWLSTKCRECGKEPRPLAGS